MPYGISYWGKGRLRAGPFLFGDLFVGDPFAPGSLNRPGYSAARFRASSIAARS